MNSPYNQMEALLNYLNAYNQKAIYHQIDKN